MLASRPMSHSPSLAEFRAAASHGNLVPVWREIVLDGDTPVSAYAKLGRGPYSFLLESVVGGEKWAAYSFVGVKPRAVIRAKGNAVEILRPSTKGGEGFEVVERRVEENPLEYLHRTVSALTPVVPA